MGFINQNHRCNRPCCPRQTLLRLPIFLEVLATLLFQTSLHMFCDRMQLFSTCSISPLNFKSVVFPLVLSWWTRIVWASLSLVVAFALERWVKVWLTKSVPFCCPRHAERSVELRVPCSLGLCFVCHSLILRKWQCLFSLTLLAS